jgi:membrane-associated protease RseP (regulator of RpoE activity)
MRPMMNMPAPLRLWSAATAVLAVVMCTAAVDAQTCRDGMPRTATLGIGLLHCVGGTCMVHGPDGGGTRHDFSTEPRAWELEPGGPAARALREGDQITSIDGVLITTRDGGRRLANLRPGVPLRLGIRRGGAETVVRVVPAPGCNQPALAVTASPEKPDWRPPAGARRGEHPRREPGPGVYFGMELDCGDCGWRQENGAWRWHASEPLRVKSVVPGAPAERAGIRPGDVLLSIAGKPLTPAGTGHLAAGLHPGEPVSFQLRRGERTLVRHVVPELRRE